MYHNGVDASEPFLGISLPPHVDKRFPTWSKSGRLTTKVINYLQDAVQ